MGHLSSDPGGSTMRLDRVLVERGLARSRSHAQDLIKSGQVKVAGRLVERPARIIDGAAPLQVNGDPWVSRGAHKLIGALDDSGLAVPPRVLDAGASTGGFTQVLLSRGARCVYAVDVGHDQLATQLRADPRVRDIEGLNVRDLTLSVVDGVPVPLIVGDVSFISLRLLLAPLASVLDPHGRALLLVKPQFEVGPQGLDGRGVVRDGELRRAAVRRIVDAARDLGLESQWQGPSRLPGPAGNVEYFVCFRWSTFPPSPG